MLRLVQACRRHDHPRRTEAALEALGLQKGLLHRMQFAVARQAFDGGDDAVLGAIGGVQTRVYGISIDHHRAGAAIPGVAAFFHTEIAEFAQ